MPEGNMYEWVSSTWNPIGGECPHKCSYCYVGDMKNRFDHNRIKYSGIPCVDEKALGKVPKGDLVFVSSMADLFAEGVDDSVIRKVLSKTRTPRYSNKTYLFQSKNPKRFLDFKPYYPPSIVFGTTLETTQDIPEISKAPSPFERYSAMLNVKDEMYDVPRMVSIEPVMKMCVGTMVSWIRDIEPEFVSIGADSKKKDIKEPTKDELMVLISELNHITEVKIKNNLERLK